MNMYIHLVFACAHGIIIQAYRAREFLVLTDGQEVGDSACTPILRTPELSEQQQQSTRVTSGRGTRRTLNWSPGGSSAEHTVQPVPAAPLSKAS